MSLFATELDFFISHQQELVDQYLGKFLVIKGENIIGAYDSPQEAYYETQKEHQLGTFMIQPCGPGTEAYTVTISTLAIAV